MNVIASFKKLYQKCLSVNSETDAVSYISLYRFASKWDKILIVIGLTATLLKSLCIPMLNIIFSEYTSFLVERTTNFGPSPTTKFLPLFGGGKILTNGTKEENYQEILNDTIAYAILMILTSFFDFIVGIICIDCFNYSALRQITRIRKKFFESLMRQEIGWYDVVDNSENSTVQLIENIECIYNGISEKVSHFLILIMSFLFGIITSLIYGWKLTLVMMLYVPVVFIINWGIGKFQSALYIKEIKSYSEAENVAEEVLGNIRTVVAFGGEQLEMERFNKGILKAKKARKLNAIFSGIAAGIVRFLFYTCNAFALWYGVQLVLENRDKIEKEYTPSVLMIIFMGLVVGARNLENMSPMLEVLNDACVVGTSIFRVIDRQSKIDPMSDEGLVPNSDIQGSITFRNVHFGYPSRSEVQVLRGVDFKIQFGETVALVGDSGDGKTTCLQLLQRFYDPDEGQIFIDDYDIRTLNVNVLRSNIAIVAQEPVLFATTIGENIRYGKPDATDDEIIAAAKLSGAHDFIVKLPLGYDTLVGEKGSQLSGGQKQRIAVTRAMIQNPKILLLDEATSALDYQSEKYVQMAMNKASKDRTTIIVSHRLSAIRNANRILFIENGLIIEDGTHEQLMALESHYFDMIKSGRMEDAYDDEFNDDDVNVTECDEKDEFHHLPTDDTTMKSDKIHKNIECWKLFKRIIDLARSKLLTMSLSTILLWVGAAASPLMAILFGEVYGALSLDDVEAAAKESNRICMIFLVVGVLTFIGTICQMYWSSDASVEISTRAQSMTFAAMLQQECAWYDDKNNSPGALLARITDDAADLEGVLDSTLSDIIHSVFAVLIGISLAIGYSVKLSIACIAGFPLSLLTVIMETKYMTKFIVIEKKSLEISTQIATEAISNIRTVASLRQEKFIIRRYASETIKMAELVRKKTALRGLVSASAAIIPTLANGFTLCYGAFLVMNGEIHFKNIIKVNEVLMYANIDMAYSLIHIPTIASSFVGAQRIFQIIDRKSLIKSPITEQKNVKPDNKNDIKYKDVDFSYPMRPDAQVLRDLNLDVMQGKTIGLIGRSGCGKSTCVHLLQRLYDPQSGHINIGSDEITKDISITGLRSKFGIVSQEPVLFHRTIAENIAYGDNTRKISMDEIENAARLANAHNFISQLPMGYETYVGNRGAHLSGGQKQRIAIARALIRNPKILLLDEATSALDLKSEKIIQQALDTVRSGRTCLIIAHRLSTIQNADVICVLHAGNIVEYGTHYELLALGGIYTRLYNAQKCFLNKQI